VLHTTTSEPPRQPDYVFVGVASACVFILVVPLAVAAFSLQRLLQPADAVLFGPTPIGEIMFAVPAILLGLVPAITAALAVANRVLRGLSMPEVALPPVAAWAQSMN
jgi:hypothetical protein